MDVLSALEGMATRFEDAPALEPDSCTIERWKILFHFADPYEVIIEYRQSLNVPTVSDTLWSIIHAEEEAKGHDRESYEYSLTLLQRTYAKVKPKQRSTRSNQSHYLLRLMPVCPPIATPEAIQAYARLDSKPTVEKDENQGRVFVRVSGTAKKDIEAALGEEYPHVRPLFVRIVRPATKGLHATSIYPTLGTDSTLPHHRLNTVGDLENLVHQNEFPVWYFFYGTLGNENVLRRVLGMDDGDIIVYEPAQVRSAALTTWGGKYKGLVDGIGAVEGWAYLVKGDSDEQKLRHYETEHYEVVRCEMDMGDGTFRRGLTFRYMDSF